MRALVLLIAGVAAGCSFEHGQPAAVVDDALGSRADGSPSDAPVTPGDAPTSVADAAVDAPPNTVTCPGAMCGNICCQGSCVVVVTAVCSGTEFECDGPEDCSGNEVCCNNKDGSVCASQCNDGSLEVCHSGADCSGSCNECSYESEYGQKVCCE